MRGLYFQMPHSLIDLERKEQQDLQMQTPFIVKFMDVDGKEHKRKPLYQNLLLEDLDWDPYCSEIMFVWGLEKCNFNIK